MQTILDKIMATKKQELETLKRRFTCADMRKKALDCEPSATSLDDQFVKGKINVIAEMKRASPSAGILCPSFDAARIAGQYERAGARALSILTDATYFKGSLDDIVRARTSTKLPILRKDFTADEYHLYEARTAQANAILLIVAALDDYQLRDYKSLAEELKLSVLVEIHTLEEWQRIKDFGFGIIGINNRNLKTLKTDVKITKSLLPHIRSAVQPADGQPARIISESGLAGADILQDLAKCGIDGFLIGEAMLKGNPENPGDILQKWLAS